MVVTRVTCRCFLSLLVIVFLYVHGFGVFTGTISLIGIILNHFTSAHYFGFELASCWFSVDRQTMLSLDFSFLRARAQVPFLINTLKAI